MKGVLLISCLIFAIGGGSTVFVFYNLNANEEKNLDNQVSTEARYTVAILDNNLASRITALERMAQRWAVDKGTDSIKWASDAQNYWEDQPGYQAIEYIDTAYRIRWVEPLAGNESVFDLNLSFEKRRRDALAAVAEDQKPIVSATIDLVQGGKGFLVYVPICDSTTYYGMIAGVFSFQGWLEHVIPKHIQNDFGIVCGGKNRDIAQIFSHDKSDLSKHSGAFRYVNGDLDFKIILVPTKAFIDEYLTAIPELVLVFGLVVSFLISLVLYNIITITRARRRERKSSRRLEIAYQRLAYQNKEAEHLTYIVSHDLMEPVRTMTSFMELLKRDYDHILDQKGQDYVMFMMQSTERMQQLIRGLLDHSRIGKQIDYRDLDMNTLVEAVISDLDASINEHHASITTDDLPNAYGNQTDIRLLIQNIIGNAIKYRQKGISPKIHISGIETDKSVQYSIQDNGIGIPLDQHDKVFKIFQRLHQNDAYDGTGIGLAHCQKVIESHGGRIWVRI